MEERASEVIRDRVRADHARLRTLLNTVLVGACVAQQDPHLVRRVRASLDRVREEILAHLDFEEDALLELLRRADAWGGVRAEELLSEHATERSMLDAVVEDFDAGDRSFHELADEIAWLASAIENDMADEERRYLTDEAIGESSPVSIHQTDG